MKTLQLHQMETLYGGDTDNEWAWFACDSIYFILHFSSSGGGIISTVFEHADPVCGPAWHF